MVSDKTDRAWFESEAVRLLPDLFGTALRLTRNRADAEDLVADTVAKAWTGLDSLQSRESFRGWVFRILTNAFISTRRTAAARLTEALEEEPGEESQFSLFERLHQPFLLWWGNPEQAFLDRVLREDIERAIDTLPEASRLVVIMADLQGLSYAEIAEALGVPVGTVRSRLARARSALQRKLWQHAQDRGYVRKGEGKAP